MKKFIKENWFRIGILIILIVLVSGFLYFQSVRPMVYKQYCAKISYSEGFGSVLNNIDEDKIYKICLHKYGL